jgi:hypothetical protein
MIGRDGTMARVDPVGDAPETGFTAAGAYPV